MRLAGKMALALAGVMLASSASAWTPDLAFYEQDGDIARGTLSMGLGYFTQDSSWYGQSRDNIGEKSGDWWEAAVVPGVEGEVGIGELGQLYGRVSVAGSYTHNADASGTNAGLGNGGQWKLEDAYLGWRSGELLSLGEDALDLSIGRQNYRAGSGFLFWTNASNGRKRGGYWLAPRKAADLAAIARLQSGDLSVDAIYLNPNDLPDSETKITGLTLDYSLGDLGGIGGGYYRVLSSERRSRDGMNVFDIRADLTPLPTLPGFGLQAEYVYEKNGSTQAASGGYAKLAYLFEGLPWSPTLSYRLAYFEGDDPSTSKNENFDALYYGFNDWGSWYQGEILGEYVLGNENLIAHTVELQAAPMDDLDLRLFYFQFRLDDPEGFDPGVSARAFAKEIDLAIDWSPTDSLVFSAVTAVSIPDEGARQYTGGDDNWWYFMLSASLSF